MPYIVLVPALLVVLYLAASYYLYQRAFVPPKPRPLDDFTFTPFEFQADYEEVELVTAEVDAVGGDQLDLLVDGLELERSEGEVVEGARLRGHERPAVQVIGRDDVQQEESGGDQHDVRHRDLNRSLTPLCPPARRSLDRLTRRRGSGRRGPRGRGASRV